MIEVLKPSLPRFTPPHMNLPVRSCDSLLQSHGSTCTSSWEKAQEKECIWWTPDTQLILSHTEGEEVVYSCIKMMIQETSKSLRAEVVASGFHITNLVEVRDLYWEIQVACSYPLSWCICYRNVIIMVLSRWGCPLRHLENAGLLNSLTKVLQHHGGQDAEHFHSMYWVKCASSAWKTTQWAMFFSHFPLH